MPERREERTTEGGLSVANAPTALSDQIKALKAGGIRVSLFVEADPATIEASARRGAHIVELHTGRYCELALENDAAGVARELARITQAARLADAFGLEVHAGHGLTYLTMPAIAQIPQIVELNIGHFLMGEALFAGLDATIRRMRLMMDQAR